jgi:glc operon protein GlcG
MRRIIGIAASAALMTVAGTALAADGDQFLIKGKDTMGMLEQSMLNVDTAEKIAKACVAEAAKEGVKVSIAIMDQFGEPIYFYRMDGQGKINIDTAFMKAKTVLNTRQPSKATMNAVAQGRGSEFRQWTFGNFNNSGGLPIVVNGNQFVGAIGVGGSAPRVFDANPWSDEICAHRALTQVMGKQPDLLPDIRPQDRRADAR